MFEKEAEEWADKMYPCDGQAQRYLLMGAKFGYNKAKEDSDKMKSRFLELCNLKDMRIKELEKANEWHYVKDGDLPTKELEEKQLLIRVRNYTEDYIFAYYMLDKYYSKNGKRFYSDTDCDIPINIKKIIAWKEIVLPELPKESK